MTEAGSCWTAEGLGEAACSCPPSPCGPSWRCAQLHKRPDATTAEAPPFAVLCARLEKAKVQAEGVTLPAAAGPGAVRGAAWFAMGRRPSGTLGVLLLLLQLQAALGSLAVAVAGAGSGDPRLPLVLNTWAFRKAAETGAAALWVGSS